MCGLNSLISLGKVGLLTSKSLILVLKTGSSSLSGLMLLDLSEREVLCFGLDFIGLDRVVLSEKISARTSSTFFTFSCL